MGLDKHAALAGLSPRVRGKRGVFAGVVVGQGSIPACAGETTCTFRIIQHCAVYPRVCGGNPSARSGRNLAEGLSPRVRGKRRQLHQLTAAPWSIPACAGETLAVVNNTFLITVYPRVCGGNKNAHLLAAVLGGLSPRVRGKRKPPGTTYPRRWSIPACAGETAVIGYPIMMSAVYPRVCGGNAGRMSARVSMCGLSPRVRGKRERAGDEFDAERSIPACAGETPDQGRRASIWEVYPRVCGGNCYCRCV